MERYEKPNMEVIMLDNQVITSSCSSDCADAPATRVPCILTPIPH